MTICVLTLAGEEEVVAVARAPGACNLQLLQQRGAG